MNSPLDFLATFVRRSAPWLAAFALVTACGGGQSERAGESVASPQADGSCDAVGGIEGGGRQKLSGVISDLGTSGEVTVSNVRIATADAVVVVDGANTNVSALRLGDVATVAGTIDLGNRVGCAARVFADADITGPIEALDLDVGTLTVLGQRVRLESDTVFGGDVRPSQLDSLQIGDRIRVSGLQALGSIVATRIDRAIGQEGYFLAGVVAGLDTPGHRFMINEITVQYEGASLTGFPAGEPRDGDSVRLSGTTFVAGDPSTPGTTVLRPAQVEYIDYDTPLSIQPASASLDSGNSMQFVTSSGAGAVTWQVANSDGSACSPSDCGTIDLTGRYSAPVVERPAPGLLVTVTSVADPRNRATAVVLVHGTPGTISGLHTVSGEVFAFETGMIGNASVNLWVQQARFGYSYWWANGPLESDDAGLFEAPYLPDSRVSVYAWTGGYVQPCAVTSNVQSDVVVRVELMPVSAFDASPAPRPQLAVEPSLSGVIFETTESGRQPVAGAFIWLEETMGITYGTTLSDRGGGYFVCNLGNLPTAAWLTITKDGFETRSVGLVNSTTTRVMDIELQRL